MKTSINQDNQLSAGIANFAGALAGFKPIAAQTS